MPARVVVTGRAGGVSAPPYDGNNLALHVGDEPSAVEHNRRALALSLGVPHVVFMRQRHGADVGVVRSAAAVEVPDVDALVTDVPGVAIAVLVADCVPVVLTAPRAVAVAHAGRRGVTAGVVPTAVAALERLAAGPVRARIGPSVCGRCYEVPADMQHEVAAIVPAARAVTRWGTPALDLRAAVTAQLHDAGVTRVADDGICTVEEAGYFSHRRDGVTGRFAAVAMLTG